MSNLALSGLTVFTLEQAVAAPICSRQLAEQGARVINIERPEWWFVDPERTVPTDFDREAAHRLLMRFQADGFWSWI